MKKLLLTIGLLGLFTAPLSFACDEMCQKEAAAKKTGVAFPGYLTWKYCDGIKGEFMTTTMKSLQSYSEQHLDVNRRRGMHNTKSFLEQRKDWLSECDVYISATGKGRIFKDDKTTKDIMDGIQSVADELGSLVSGVTYGSQNTPTGNQAVDDTQVARDKFNQLFTMVDNHKNLLLLKGQMITSR